MFTLNPRNYVFLSFLLAFSLRVAAVVSYSDDNKFSDYDWNRRNTHVPMGDDFRYVQIAKNLLDGRGYPVIHEQPPYETDFRRPPLYTLFIAGVFSVFGFDVIPLLVMQALIAAAGVFPLYRIAKDQFNEKTARIAVVFWAVYPMSIFWTLAVYRETISSTLVLLITWRFLCLFNSFSTKNAIYLGIAGGVGLLFEPSIRALMYGLGAFYVFHLFLPVQWKQFRMIAKNGARAVLNSCIENMRRGWRSRLRYGLLTGAVLGFTLFPWFAYFFHSNGYISFTRQTAFGSYDNSLYFFSRRLSNQVDDDAGAFERDFTQYRYSIAKSFLTAEQIRADTTYDKMTRRLQDLKSNTAFLSELNRIGRLRRDSLLAAHPELYWGQPFGKELAIRFFNIWLNFMPSHTPNQLVNISTLKTMAESRGTWVYYLGWMLLVFYIIVFGIYIAAGWRRGLLLFWLFMVPFLVLMKNTSSNEGRYLLSYHPLLIITLSFFATFIKPRSKA